VEKAYAFFRYGQNSYASINGGWMSTTYREITGNYTTTSLLTDPADTLYNYFATQLAQGHAVTLGSEYSAVSPVVGGHAYMVKSAQIIGGQRYLTVFNPWGGDGRDWDSNPGDGLLTLSMEQVQTNFSAAVVSLA
jgi:hypothetical protein